MSEKSSLKLFKEDKIISFFFNQNSRGLKNRTVIISLVHYRFIASGCCGKAMLRDERFSIAISWTGGTMMSNVLIIFRKCFTHVYAAHIKFTCCAIEVILSVFQQGCLQRGQFKKDVHFLFLLWLTFVVYLFCKTLKIGV